MRKVFLLIIACLLLHAGALVIPAWSAGAEESRVLPAVPNAPVSPLPGPAVNEEKFDTSSPSPLDRFLNIRFYVNVVLALLVISGAIYLTLRLFYGGGISPKAGGTAGRKKALRILEKQALTPQKFLCVVEAADRYYLLGVGESQINVLTELEREKAAALYPQGEAISAEFSPFQIYLANLFAKKGSRKQS